MLNGKNAIIYGGGGSIGGTIGSMSCQTNISCVFTQPNGATPVTSS